MAIELPNGKISRTLPEQVGFNSEKIAEIIKAINDFELIDKVINLSDASGTLTGDQYSIAELSPSYIVYSGKVFIKAYEDGTNIDFIEVGALTGGSTTLTLSVERIRVVVSTKAYQYAVVQLFESYTKSQIDSLISTINTSLSGKADLTGATFTGSVSATKLEQSTANYVLDFTFGTPQEGLTVENIYNRFEVINNILYMVVNIKAKNEGESSVTAYQLSSSWKYLDSAVASKIYDLNGNSVSVAASPRCLITAGIGFVTDDKTLPQNTRSSAIVNFMNVNGVRACELVVRFNSGLTIPAASERYITARLFLTLL